ncbi:MAG: LysM peptidoglycan-binding domain-containing protein [Treponema sp.]|nr:LysM peptidoglycan-binding domain-containing protein [Candidatus Treponema equifaecale]
MKTIGIKLADGTFYPILEEGAPKKRMLDLTTAKDNQTKVQIDLYRSENGSMEDAEYVDTLEVTKLVPHPNGEPELHLSIGLDEENNLTAEVVDPETGKKSETEVNLVNRTLAERSSPADFAINETDISPASDVAADSIVDDFAFDDDPTNPDPVADDTTLAPEDLPEIKSDALEDMSFSFDSSEAFASDEPANNIEETVSEDTFSTDDLDDLGISDTTLESVSFGEESVPEDTVAEDTVADTDTTSGADEFSIDEFTTDSLTDDFAADSVSDDFATDTSANETVSDDLDLPDFDSFEVSDDSKKDDTEVAATGLDFGDLSAFDTPDFDSPVSESNDFSTDFDSTTTSDFSTDFDTSDLDETLDSLNSQSESGAGYTSGSAMDFSDLYDKETLNGEHASLYDDEEEEKKTRVPVIICIICAIICVIATILVLFIVPSKYNLIKSRNTKNVETVVVEKAPVAELPESAAPVEETPIQIVEKEVEPVAPAAEENKVIVVEEPAKVVPAPAPKSEKKPDVKHHIRWGDTLWDISDSYYKTPWKYKKIAKYNKIRNPDLIISGEDLMIPAE